MIKMIKMVNIVSVEIEADVLVVWCAEHVGSSSAEKSRAGGSS